MILPYSIFQRNSWNWGPEAEESVSSATLLMMSPRQWKTSFASQDPAFHRNLKTLLRGFSLRVALQAGMSWTHRLRSLPHAGGINTGGSHTVRRCLLSPRVPVCVSLCLSVLSHKTTLCVRIWPRVVTWGSPAFSWP